MDGTSTSAMLVGTREMLASESDGLTVTLPREEIEAALASDPPNELILDILRKVEGRDEPERRTVNVAWKRPDLESVIDDPAAEAITFSFDPAELDRLLSEPDVEGHGLREAAVVLSIAAAAAVGGAASASAATHDEAGMTARGIQGTVAAVASTHDEAGLAARGIEGTVAATHDEATSTARGIEQGAVAATHDEATSAARGIEPGTVAAVAATHDEATLAARGIESTSPADTATVSSGSRFDLPSVDSTTAASIAAALGAFGLAILGASFLSRRREPGAA
jgi:MYXO-CTERM domain-containing protein